VADWARLKALAARYLAGDVFKLDKSGNQVPAELPSAILSQIAAREDRLYLSPLARKKARTSITESAPSKASTTAGGNVVVPDRWKRSAS
jgi:hypothetical protein